MGGRTQGGGRADARRHDYRHDVPLPGCRFGGGSQQVRVPEWDSGDGRGRACTTWSAQERVADSLAVVSQSMPYSASENPDGFPTMCAPRTREKDHYLTLDLRHTARTRTTSWQKMPSKNSLNQTTMRSTSPPLSGVCELRDQIHTESYETGEQAWSGGRETNP